MHGWPMNYCLAVTIMNTDFSLGFKNIFSPLQRNDFMNVQNLIDKLNLEIICDGNGLEGEIDGCYATDLLSLAMSNVRAGNVWITVQTNMNILGIAALTDTSCVIIAQNMNIPADVCSKAVEENICLLRSDMTVYELCKKIGALI